MIDYKMGQLAGLSMYRVALTRKFKRRFNKRRHDRDQRLPIETAFAAATKEVGRMSCDANVIKSKEKQRQHHTQHHVNHKITLKSNHLDAKIEALLQELQRDSKPECRVAPMIETTYQLSNEEIEEEMDRGLNKQDADADWSQQEQRQYQKTGLSGAGYHRKVTSDQLCEATIYSTIPT